MRKDLGDENRRPSEFRCDQRYHCFKAQMLFTDGCWCFFLHLLYAATLNAAMQSEKNHQL